MPTSNWKKIGNGLWFHTSRKEMTVSIRTNQNKARPEPYQVFHMHPGRDGGVIPQEPEYAKTKHAAELKAGVHRRHWNDPRKWREYW